MSFNSFIGLFFSIAVIAIYWAIPKNFRNVFLLIASFCFYAYGDILYSFLLATVIAIGFISGRLIDAGVRPKLTIGAAIAAMLVILGVFKYFNFFSESFGAVFEQFGLKVDTVTLQLLLPIGISFYTFQTIGYLIDVYRKQTRAEKNLIDFALFVSFFPQLVAGPIERSRNLLLQVKSHLPAPTKDDVAYGVFLISQGYAKKIFIADTLGPYVDLLFQQDGLSAPLIIVGALFFAFQIYGDFSGYTDIARGYARLLGYNLILNFDRPYYATSPSNFWRRWHISLSSWFTEYVYIPLGGNRSSSSVRRWFNVIATMGLSGLWHGASMNFIWWGIFHGAIILMQRAVSLIPRLGSLNDTLNAIPSRIATFVLVLYGWLLFRIEDFELLGAYHVALASNWSGWYEATLLLSQGLTAIFAVTIIDASEKYWLDVHGMKVKQKRWRSVYVGGLIAVVILFAPGTTANFIYFRF